MEALRAFLSVSSQFQMVSPGDGTLRRVALDYHRAKAGFELAEIAMNPELWADVQIIEDAVVGVSFEEGS